jgi:hypothetical protein
LHVMHKGWPSKKKLSPLQAQSRLKFTAHASLAQKKQP